MIAHQDTVDRLPHSEAEHIAIEHVAQRRREGWNLADCWVEACQCLRVCGFPPPRMGCHGWDDVTRAYAAAWECLPVHQRADWMREGSSAA